MKTSRNPTRCAIYARYSSERQNERSIEDQVAICRRAAQQRGWAPMAIFSDAAISGAAMANRPGLHAALAAAERGDFDVLLCEDEDRIARNLEHLAHVVNRLEYASACLSTLTTEKVETMHVAMKGFLAQDYLRNLSAKTRRGMMSNAEKGLATGSRIYGYRTQPGGAQEIMPQEAEVVREIFRRYGAGETGRAICADLNARAVPGPRGGFWNPSTLSGSRTRGNGLLATELYAGVKVWNRIEMRKDPQTGQRVSRARPPSEWKRTEVPTLRIVSDDLWSAVQARRDARAVQTPYDRNPSKRGLFSGLIKCAACGSSMTAFNSRGRLICTARREKGPAVCGNDRSVDRGEVERRVLEGLRARLLSPEAVKAYVRLYHEAWQAEQAAATASIAPLRKRIGELSRSIVRLVDKICDGTDTPETNRRLVDEEEEKARLELALAQAEAEAPPPLTLHPKAAEMYADRIAKLQSAIRENSAINSPDWLTVIEGVRDLVVRIEVGVDYAGELKVSLSGTLAAFMQPQENEKPPRLYKVVAGGGIEPPTCGL